MTGAHGGNDQQSRKGEAGMTDLVLSVNGAQSP